jgi:hypothetical protein
MERYKNSQDWLGRKLKAAKALAGMVHVLPDPAGYRSDHFRHLEEQEEVLQPSFHEVDTLQVHHTKDGFVANRNESELGWTDMGEYLERE